MRVLPFLLVLGLLAACSANRGDDATTQARAGRTVADAGGGVAASVRAARTVAGIAALPDRGQLLAYKRTSGGIVRGAYTWHPVDLSEAHALGALASGELRLRAPDGRAIRLRYARHIEHADGNWTWIGREAGSLPGTEAVITFGERAVFGSIPNGMKLPLRLMMADGRTWLVETDAAAVARLHAAHVHPRTPDFLVPPRRVAGQARTARDGASTIASGMPAVAQATATPANTVDLLLGYTTAFASRYGGQSGAITRLTYLVDIANVAYANSQVDARLRLVGTRQVDYPDATSNEEALYDLTGVECTRQSSGLDCDFVDVPAALQPLHDARDQYGADLVSLVRNFNDPENEGCGIAWLNGGGQVAISPADEITGLSVVSDSGGSRYPDNKFVCREESLAHEIGHNMGSAHDRDTADGDDNALQGNEYGRYPYSFGYKTGAGGFFTVMAYGNDDQVGYRVFSNPAINHCGGQPCGVANQADNARSLRQTIPVVANFRADSDVGLGIHFSGDFNGDGDSDVLWYNRATGASTLWRSGNRSTRQTLWTVTDLRWRIVAVGDFGGDGKSDIFWNNRATGANTIWKSANRSARQVLPAVSSVDWQAAGAGDFNGDGRSDILWRNRATGSNAIWLSANKATQQSVARLSDPAMKVGGIGDFNGDGKDDILWRNPTSGANAIWRSASAGATQAVTGVAGPDWQLAGVGDYGGDGRADLFWRNPVTGANVIWRSASRSLRYEVSGVADARWGIVSSGDFNGDGKADVFWRNSTTGDNTIWRSADRPGYLDAAEVRDVNWTVVP